MYITTEKTGKTVWFCLQPDADFGTYGYYVEAYSDEDGASRIDCFNTYNFDEQESARIARVRIASEEYVYE